MTDHKKPRQESDCTVKQRHTSHWDMDYLSRQEVDALMQQPRTGSSAPLDAVRPATDDPMPPIENPLRLGLLLLAGAALLFTAGLLLLRL